MDHTTRYVCNMDSEFGLAIEAFFRQTTG